MKVETAGDCYIVAGGILGPDGEGFNHILPAHDPVESARRVFAFAMDFLRHTRGVGARPRTFIVLVGVVARGRGRFIGGHAICLGPT